jgi:hypothetical protein
MLFYDEVPGSTDESAPFKILLLVTASVLHVKVVLRKVFCIISGKVIGRRPVSVPQ